MPWTDGLQPWLRPAAAYLVEQARVSGLAPVITSVYRSYGQQAALYRRYRAGLSRLPAAPPGRSLHQQGRAFDVDLPQHREVLPQMGAAWRSMGGRWWPSDPVHFEA